MFHNNNMAKARSLSIKCLQANKKRNIVAIVAIILTTILFTTVFTVGYGALYSFEQQTLKHSGDNSHVLFEFMTKDQFLAIKEHPSLVEVGEKRMLGLAENKELHTRFVEINYGNYEEAKSKYSEPTVGTMPKAVNEFAVDTAVLDLLGIPHEIGAEVVLSFKVDNELNELREESMVLTGYWEGDSNATFCYLWVTEEFVAKELNGVTMPKAGFAGAGSYYISANFDNTNQLYEKASKVLEDTGFDINASFKEPLYIATDINDVYEDNQNNIGIGTILSVLALLILIMVSGYLIIYNIFQISIVKDIRFYGQLKTLGTSPKQLKTIVRLQGLILSCIAIPIGLSVGYLIGRILVPVMMKLSNYEGIAPPPNIWIFVGATAFSAITVFISMRKPAKTVSTLSPIEAMKCSGADTKYKKSKKSKTGAKIYRMALSNCTRSPRKTIVLVLSISLSIVLLNSVLNYTGSFSEEKYLERNTITDFVVKDILFGRNLVHPMNEGIKSQLIEEISAQQGFDDGGGVYYYRPDDSETPVAEVLSINGEMLLKDDIIHHQLYGMDEFAFSQFDIIEGNLEWEKFNSGGYIIEFTTYSISDANYGEVDIEEYQHKVGDKVTVQHGDIAEEYEVMALVASKNITAWARFSNTSFSIPSSAFLEHYPSSIPLIYLFDVEDEYLHDIDAFMENHTQSKDNAIKYSSQNIIKQDFAEMKQTTSLSGIILATIFGMIGLLNFINVIATSIIARQQEFATMQSIGMTKRQLRNMLVLEGVWYSVMAIVMALILCTATSLLFVQSLADSTWYCEYYFTLAPAMILAPCYLVIGILIPYLSFKPAK